MKRCKGCKVCKRELASVYTEISEENDKLYVIKVKGILYQLEAGDLLCVECGNGATWFKCLPWE